ncbi:MAG: 16S rRNA (guanine(527)-N(7))-methyltransferase RsmG [Xanthomonadales bacterium]|nr:16S rRNA (guanine(527)-N(7))-methyltransferase RsmG [Xanthomonadales bacterium]
MSKDRPKLASGLARLGLEVLDDGVDKLLAYMELLQEWSGTYNLVAPGERPFLLARHILDSLSIAAWLQGDSLLDIGTGAGLPGLPLAIVRPGIQVSLMDGAGKKIRFIRHVARELGLANVHPLHRRAEEASTGVFSSITSRAFASLKGFAGAARQHADDNTRLLAMKAAYPTQELEELPGWVNVESVEALAVPYLHAERHLVIMSVEAF